MKPGEFHVGVLNFFAILLPGAVATAILIPRYGDLVVGRLIPELTSDSAILVAFGVFAYFIGHLIFLLGSYLDPLYNRLRQRLDPYGNESAYQCATAIRNELLQDREQAALNTFQWARAVLIATCPAAADDVHGLEADSKFFRSLFVLFMLLALSSLPGLRGVDLFVWLLVAVLCFARYYERRLKSTTQAYMHVIALHRLGKLQGPASAGQP